MMHNEDLKKEFFKQLSNSEYLKALELFHQGLDCKTHSPKYEYPLILAIKYRKHDIAVKLIQNGVDVNFQHKDNFKTPIFYAIEQNMQDLYYMLIEAGARLDAEDKDQNTLLIAAIEAESPRVALDLIKRGCDLNVQHRNTHETALFRAVKKELASIALELVKRGADVDIQNQEGLTAFLWALKNNKAHIADKLLLYVKDINLYTKEGSALHFAIKNQMYNLIYKIINSNFESGKLDTNILDSEGNSSLMLAIKNKMPHIAAKMMEQGANIHFVDSRGCSLLALSLREGNEEIFELLVSKGADLNAICIDSAFYGSAHKHNSIFMELIALNKTDMVLRAIKYVKLDLHNKDNDTALTLAVRQSNPDILLSLVEHGALRSEHFSEIPNKALELALSKTEWFEMQRVLLSHGAVPPHEAEYTNYHQFDSQLSAVVQVQEVRNLAFEKYNLGDTVFASRALATKCSGHSLVDTAISHGKHMKFLEYLDLWLEKGKKVGFTSADQFNKYHKVIHHDVNFINFTKACKNILDHEKQSSELSALNFDILSEILGHLPTSREQEYGKIYHIHQDLNYDVHLLGNDPA